MSNRLEKGDFARAVPPPSWSWPRREILVQGLVWVAAAVLCLVLLDRHSGSPNLTGLARGRVVQLSVPWSARVEAVPVKLFQRVRRDEVVAILDHSVLAAQIAQVEAEIARLRSEHDETQGLLDADVQARRSEWDGEIRAFARDASELAIRLGEVQVDLEYDRAMLQGLEATVASFEGLVKSGHAAPAEVELVRAEAAATAKRGEVNARLAAELEARLAEAEAERAQHLEHEPLRPSRTFAADHLEQAIAVQLGLRGELEAQRAQCILKAPFDGTIVEIAGRAGEAALRRPGEGDIRRPGEVVGPGDAVVAIAADRPTQVVAYAPDGGGPALRPGLEVELVNLGAVRQVATSVIESVGPVVERLPESLWAEGQVPRWGRPFLVPLPDGFEVAAGDRVGVRLP